MERICQKSKGRSQNEQRKVNTAYIKSITLFAVLSLLLFLIACAQQKTTEQPQQLDSAQPQQPTVETQKDAVESAAIPIAIKTADTEQPQEADDELNDDNLDVALKDLDEI